MNTRVMAILLTYVGVAACSGEPNRPPELYRLVGSAETQVGAAQFLVSGAANVVTECSGCYVNSVGKNAWRVIVLGRPTGTIATATSSSVPSVVTEAVAADRSGQYAVLDTSTAHLVVAKSN